MQTSTIRFYSLGFQKIETYWLTVLFVLGNIALPQLCHVVQAGGPTWLPIYFFTLIGAYKYGWRVGLLTALISPLINSLLFGMPTIAMLPTIMLKSTLLALTAGYVATKFHKATLGLLTLVILTYQVIGSLGEWALVGNLHIAMQDFQLGIPGMLLQVFGGWLVINRLIRK